MALRVAYCDQVARPSGYTLLYRFPPAMEESNFGGYCGGVSPFHELSVHVCHCGVIIVMSLEVSLFKWEYLGTTGIFIDGVGGRILLGGAGFLRQLLGGGWG